MDKALIGLKVKTIREHRKISQAKLAEIINISDNTLSNIKTGKYYPRVDTLIALSNALNVSLVFLISDCTCPTKICVDKISKCLFILDDAVSKHLMEYLHPYASMDFTRLSRISLGVSPTNCNLKSNYNRGNSNTFWRLIICFADVIIVVIK